jgi:hypothetical protein
MAITRTFPAEWTTIAGADEAIIYSIRERIGDRPELNRYYLTANSDNMPKYIMEDNVTFNDNGYRFWPYHLSISGSTVASGVNVLRYKYMDLAEASDGNVKDDNLDFWVEVFYLSDFEIWTAYLNVDLTPHVRKPECITETMEILKAAIDLLPALRASKKDYFYANKRVRDNDTEFEKSMMSGVDPHKDLLMALQKELDGLIDRCNKTPYMDGYRIE